MSTQLAQWTLTAFLVPYYLRAIEDDTVPVFMRQAMALWKDWLPEAPRNRQELRKKIHYELEWGVGVYEQDPIDKDEWVNDLTLKRDRQRRVKAWFDAAKNGIFEEGPQYRDLIAADDRVAYKRQWKAKLARERDEESLKLQKQHWLDLIEEARDRST